MLKKEYGSLLRIRDIKFNLTDEITPVLISERTGIKLSDIESMNFFKKAVDARKKSDIHYTCTIDFKLKNEKKYLSLKNASVIKYEKYEFPKALPLKSRPIIIGSGPSGLFAALMLAENGHAPIVFERGERVEERTKSVALFGRLGKLNPNSNIQFGEGGAGTFSDGKLTTGIKNKRCRTVLENFVKFGAPEEILYQSKPHIGTDLLCTIVKNMREHIIACGGEFHFNSCVDGFVIKNSRLCAVRANEKEYSAESVILATGHSARDTMETLFNLGVKINQKPFSVGARIEHSQKMINESQYGKSAPLLGAADYKLSAHLENGRGVYTFCMCPGGSVVCASSEPGGIVTNGMSNYARGGKNANAALLVGVGSGDFGSEHPLAGIEFQRQIERKAFEAAGGAYRATAQRVGDFLNHAPSEKGGNIVPTCKPEVRWGQLDDILPSYVCSSMREGILLFDKKLEGFAAADAVLTGPETRSSSPVRFERDENFLSNIRGLYPCGEGAGYAGGIMSAAVDGIACAEALVINAENNINS